MIRLAGVYSMAALADDWYEQRQTCLNMLCAYLRFPYAERPPDGAPAIDLREFATEQEIRQAVITVMAAHLKADSERSSTLQDWRINSFDFTGAAFDGGDFSGAEFRGQVDFSRAQFRSGTVAFRGVKFGSDDSGPCNDSIYKIRVNNGILFRNAVFSGAEVAFDGAVIRPDCRVDFSEAVFSGGAVYLNARFQGRVIAKKARFLGTSLHFGRKEYTEGFAEARFEYGYVSFEKSVFEGGIINFGRSNFDLGRCNTLFAGEFAGTIFDLTELQEGSDYPFVATEMENAYKLGFMKVRKREKRPIIPNSADLEEADSEEE